MQRPDADASPDDKKTMDIGGAKEGTPHPSYLPILDTLLLKDFLPAAFRLTLLLFLRHQLFHVFNTASAPIFQQLLHRTPVLDHLPPSLLVRHKIDPVTLGPHPDLILLEASLRCRLLLPMAVIRDQLRIQLEPLLPLGMLFLLLLLDTTFLLITFLTRLLETVALNLIEIFLVIRVQSIAFHSTAKFVLFQLAFSGGML
uniref:Uncharacterized protein n=1 Tax=Anopheles farauti TaxID=69004 RepID=A0A182QJI7_9DIPT